MALVGCAVSVPRHAFALQQNEHGLVQFSPHQGSTSSTLGRHEEGTSWVLDAEAARSGHACMMNGQRRYGLMA